MIAHIAPLVPLPPSAGTFDYFVSESQEKKIKIGQLVTIPWRLKKIMGVVLGLSGNILRAKFRARPIFDISNEQSVLTSSQIELIKRFSDYYLVTAGYTARLMIPDKPKKILKPKSNLFQCADSRFPILKSQLEKMERFAASLRVSKHGPGNDVIVIQDVASFIWFILRLMKPAKGQVLVLFPYIDLINAVGAVVQKKCSLKMGVIHSELSKGTYWNEYQKILNRTVKIILSTRQGVFLPIARESKIVFFESLSQDFKQYDQHPRYDARIVADWVSRITKSQLIFASSSPIFSLSFSHFYKSKSLPPSCESSTSIKLIDMKQEMTRRDFSIISDSVIEQIKNTIQKNKKVLIISLRQDAQNGVSVLKLSKVLTNQIKNCKIAVKYILNYDFDVLVTTAYSLEALKLTSERGKFDLAIFASIEPLLAIPDFRRNERAFNRLNFWKMMCRELRIRRIILQSYSPDNLGVRAFACGEVSAFVESELEHRKQLNYPPFSQLIKLWPKPSNDQDTNLIVQALKLRLSNRAAILGPFKDKKGRQSILLKVTKDSALDVLRSLPAGWSIDRDPENVL